MTVLEVVRESTNFLAESDTRLDALGMDSLEFIELIKEIECYFFVVIPDIELANLHTVSDLENLVRRLQSSLVRR